MKAEENFLAKNRHWKKSSKLNDVCYDIRGPVMEEAKKLEERGNTVIKLNIGNPAPFGFTAPEEIIEAVASNLRNAEGYADSRGLPSARKAVIEYCVQKGITDVGMDDVYLGNGVSELIGISTEALLDDGDELLIPAPDYPLWTAAVSLAGGKPVHYICDEESDWLPDVKDIARKITDRTKGIVVINPNNPTGAVYPKEILQQIADLAAEHGLIVFSDEIYDSILYDDAKHVSAASLSDEVLFITLNGLSKSHMIAGFRTAWMVISGNKNGASDYLEGINMLASMRLCSNVPSQYAIEIALKEFQNIHALTRANGRLLEQRNYGYQRVNSIPGLSCVKPRGAFYLFPKIDTEKFHIVDDEKFVLDFLMQEKILLVQGTGFNWHKPDHFRIVLLPPKNDMEVAFDRLEHFLSNYVQSS